jgi:hypothetical protein
MDTTISSLISSAIPTLADMALKGALLLALAGLATAALWRASAALRHLVWSLAMAGLLALPVMSALLPQWRVLPRWPALISTERSAERIAEPLTAREPAPSEPAAMPVSEAGPPAPALVTTAGSGQRPVSDSSDSPAVVKRR